MNGVGSVRLAVGNVCTIEAPIENPIPPQNRAPSSEDLAPRALAPCSIFLIQLSQLTHDAAVPVRSASNSLSACW